MRVVAILAWYDESPSWLAATVASLEKADVEHLIAVDGAYRFYPDGSPGSRPEQADAIRSVAYGLGIGLTLHVPQVVWHGNEVAKRTFCFRLAETVTDTDDWYFVVDADEIVTHANGVPEQLAATGLDVADVDLREYQDPMGNPRTADVSRQIDWPRRSRYPSRRFFRAVRGLSAEGNHYTYAVPGEDAKLWGNPSQGDQVADALDLTGSVHLEHRTTLRDLDRQNKQLAYYKIREELGFERPDYAVPA